jgi:hypothetical protein
MLVGRAPRPAAAGIHWNRRIQWLYRIAIVGWRNPSGIPQISVWPTERRCSSSPEYTRLASLGAGPHPIGDRMAEAQLPSKTLVFATFITVLAAAVVGAFIFIGTDPQLHLDPQGFAVFAPLYVAA